MLLLSWKGIINSLQRVRNNKWRQRPAKSKENNHDDRDQIRDVLIPENAGIPRFRFHPKTLLLKSGDSDRRLNRENIGGMPKEGIRVDQGEVKVNYHVEGETSVEIDTDS